MTTNPTRFADFLARTARAPEDGTGAAPAGNAGAGAGDPAPNPAPAPAGGDAPAPKWFETLPDEKRRVLESKGWNVDDPKDAAFKLLDHYSLAEKRLGKPADALMDRPAKDQKFTDWAKANGEALGLPADVAGYKVDRPADFPKDMPWDDALDTKAQQLAFEKGVPPELHSAYVGLFADHMKGIAEGLDGQRVQATATVQAELAKEWGAGMDTRMARARQTMQHFAAEAGLSDDGVSNAIAALAEKGGDPFVMKLFDAIGAAMAEDKAVNIGGQTALGMSPAEAQSQLSAMQLPGGELFEAMKAQREGAPGAAALLDAATKKRNNLTAIIAGKPAA